MRKFLFSAIALMMSVSLWAAGTGDSSKAINFDWDGENRVEAGTTVKYSLGLQDLVDRANEPVIALYLNNLTTAPSKVTIVADASLTLELPFFGTRVLKLDDFTAPKNYTIASDGHEIWTLPTTFDLTDVVNKNAALKNVFEDPKNVSLIDLCLNYGLSVSLTVTSDQLIAIATTVFEKEEILEEDKEIACANSESFDWTLGATVEAGEKWFYLDLKKVQADEKLNFVVENGNGTEVKVAFDLYLTCPATSKVLEHVWDIPANGDKKESLGRFFLNQLTKDYVYLKLTTNQTVTIKVEAEKLPDPTPADDLFDATDAIVWTGEKLQLEAGVETIVKVEKAALKADKGYKTVAYITNQDDAPVTLNQTISFEPKATIHNTTVKSLTVAAETQDTILISNKMLDNVKSDVAYFCFKASGRMAITIKKEELESSSTPKEPTIYAPACEDAYVFNWNSSITQKAMANKWYEFDIKSLKQNKEHLQLSFTNHSDSMVVVMGSILLDCNSTDTIPYILPVPGGKTMSKVLEYSLLAASPLEKAYVSAMVVPTTVTSLSDLTGIRNQEDVKKLVSLNLSTKVTLTASKSSALVDATLCETQHQTLEAGVKYAQEAGTTKWYHVTDNFIKDMGLLSTFAIANNGTSPANVTLGVTVGCDYGIHTRTSVSIPTWMDITTLYPNGLFNLVDAIVNKDITEFYVEITTDQSIEFGFGVAFEQKLGCENAINFDWNTGLTTTPRDAQWYKFDITDLKANEMQAKLTFTNTSDSLAWVAAFATYECPFKVGLPLIVPVPAGASVDKWIDYSFFASAPFNEFYLAVYTDSHIQIKAEQETAKVVPAIDCETATVIEPNVQYTINPGTSWYKLSAEPFQNATGNYATLSFANKTGETATVTTGATVGCEYGILTKGKLKVPAMDVNVNVPLWVLGVMKQFVDEDVNQYYVQVTTDKALDFQIEVELPCPDPTYVADTTISYMCPGTDYVNPYTGATLTIAQDTILVDTIATEDICLFNVHVVNLTAMQAPEAMTDATLNLIGAVPALTQGLLPDTTGTIAAIKTYYTTKDTEAIADVVSVSWTDVTVAVACDATTHALTLVVEDSCGIEHTAMFEFPVVAAPTLTHDTTIHQYICSGEKFVNPVTGMDSTIFEDTIVIYDTLASSIPCVDSVVVYVICPVLFQPMTDSILDAIGAVPVLTPGLVPDTTGTIAAIKKYYADNDTKTVADIEDVYWMNTNEVVDCESTNHTLKLYIKGECDNEAVISFNFPVTSVILKDTITETVCESYTLTQTGSVFTASGTYNDTLKNSLGCDSVIYTLHLTVLEDVKLAPVKDTIICFGETADWRGVTYKATGVYYDTVRYSQGCDSAVYTLNLTVLEDVKLAPVKDTIICFGETADWRGVTYKATGVYYDTVRYSQGCDSAIYTLNLTVLNDVVYVPAETDTICYGTSKTWRGITCSETKTYNDTVRYSQGCDSAIYTLNLTVLNDVVYVPAETDTICYGTSKTWRGITCSETKTYNDTVRYSQGCDSAIYTLHLTVLEEVTLPLTADVELGVVAICGNAIDVAVADSVVRAYVAAVTLHPTLENVLWEVKKANDTWETLTTDAIDGTVTSVSVRYTIQTTCEDVTSEPIVVTVETPTPENDEEMTNIGLYYRYGDRLLTIDLKQIQDEFGWVVAESDVTWYYIADGATPVEVGHGYYLTTVDGKPLMAGKYYARINHTRTTADDCDGILQTITYLVGAPASTPKLAPTIVKPQELISLLNLNAESISTVSVYSTMGELITSFQVSNQEQLTFPAAQQTGYYVVDVQTETEKVSLRYIVK